MKNSYILLALHKGVLLYYIIVWAIDISMMKRCIFQFNIIIAFHINVVDKRSNRILVADKLYNSLALIYFYSARCIAVALLILEAYFSFINLYEWKWIFWVWQMLHNEGDQMEEIQQGFRWFYQRVINISWNTISENNRGVALCYREFQWKGWGKRKCN